MTFSPASFSVCQEMDPSVKVFQCDIKGRYRGAEIWWHLDGQLHQDSPSTTCKYTKIMNASGFYPFTIKHITKLSRTSTPTCDVKAMGKSIIVSSGCGAEAGNFYEFMSEEMGLGIYCHTFVILSTLYRAFQDTRKHSKTSII